MKFVLRYKFTKEMFEIQHMIPYFNKWLDAKKFIYEYDLPLVAINCYEIPDDEYQQISDQLVPAKHVVNLDIRKLLGLNKGETGDDSRDQDSNMIIKGPKNPKLPKRRNTNIKLRQKKHSIK